MQLMSNITGESYVDTVDSTVEYNSTATIVLGAFVGLLGTLIRAGSLLAHSRVVGSGINSTRADARRVWQRNKGNAEEISHSSRQHLQDNSGDGCLNHLHYHGSYPQPLLKKQSTEGCFVPHIHPDNLILSRESLRPQESQFANPRQVTYDPVTYDPASCHESKINRNDNSRPSTTTVALKLWNGKATINKLGENSRVYLMQEKLYPPSDVELDLNRLLWVPQEEPSPGMLCRGAFRCCSRITSCKFSCQFCHWSSIQGVASSIVVVCNSQKNILLAVVRQTTKHSSCEGWCWWLLTVLLVLIGGLCGALAIALAPHSILIPLNTVQIIAVEIMVSFFNDPCFVERRNRRFSVVSKPKSQGVTTPFLKGPWIGLSLTVTGIVVLLLMGNHEHRNESWQETTDRFSTTFSAICMSTLLAVILVLSVVSRGVFCNRGGFSRAAIIAYPAILTAHNALVLTIIIDAVHTTGWVHITRIVVDSDGGVMLVVIWLAVFSYFQYRSSSRMLASGPTVCYLAPLYYSVSAVALFVLDQWLYWRWVEYSLSNWVGTVVGFFLILFGLKRVSAFHSTPKI
jgi:hypothetical protein